jgi:Fe-S-cluster containining protein
MTTNPVTHDLDLAQEVMAVYQELDKKTESFKESSGLSCLKGCGRCCLSNQVETTPGEWLPYALELAKTNQLDVVHSKLQGTSSQSCLMYQPNSQNFAKGSCSVYPVRPGICRLFGFSTLKNKRGLRELLTCRPIKEYHSKILDSPVDLSPDKAPSCHEYQGKIDAIFAAHPALRMRMPINQALSTAIAYVALRLGYHNEAIEPEARGPASIRNTLQKRPLESPLHLPKSLD